MSCGISGAPSSEASISAMLVLSATGN